MKINLDKTTMRVIKTAGNGVVNRDTIFHFTQVEKDVWAEYAGGKIKKGFLVGQSDGAVFQFSYCQLQCDGVPDSGASTCTLSLAENGKIQLIENFEWKSRPGEKGQNVFMEI